MTKGKVTSMSFEEGVRTRPFMYIGNGRIIDLFTGLIRDCIELCQTANILFSISLLETNRFSIGIVTEKDISPFISRLSAERTGNTCLYPNILKIVANRLEIIPNATSTYHDKTETLLNFELEQAVLGEINVDYQKLGEELFQLALLNRATEIIVRDSRQKYFKICNIYVIIISANKTPYI